MIWENVGYKKKALSLLLLIFIGVLTVVGMIYIEVYIRFYLILATNCVAYGGCFYQDKIIYNYSPFVAFVGKNSNTILGIVISIS